ncbi:hypothetical protein B0H10DRAFT_2011931 [Mycena sp. CBHHK59/15]|nr:hypothetical protein B0H10DRAFT_2011931 [Mycena sp. CBHHK59/15]
MSLRQVLESMTPDEQRSIGKQLKIRPGKTKTDLVTSILATSSTQSTLDSFAKGKAKAESGRPSSQEKRLREMIMAVLVKLVRVHDSVYDILSRVHIIFFRSTQFPTEILPRALRHRLHNYPDYACQRDSAIWVDRPALLVYEHALKAEARIDGVLPSESIPKPKRRGKAKCRAVDDDDADARDKDKESAAVLKAKLTIKVFDEIYPLWADHHALKALEDVPIVEGLERFEAGSVLTRAIHKGVKALGILNMYDKELDVINGLLGQHYWGRGLRGEWHLRRALICDVHADELEAEDEQAASRDSRALEAVKAGLNDEASGILHRPTLIKRLAKLQNRLQVSSDDRVDNAESKKVAEVVLKATRISNGSGKKKKSKTRWKGRDNEDVSVETLVSQYYEDLGFSRALAGSCALTTLFTLLLWDIIFAAVPGAFETPFQSCPLDLCEDTFFTARRDLIVLRLSEIEAGRAVHILEAHDTLYRDTKPCAVGVRWDACTRGDLRDVVKCIPPRTLATLCQMFCEDYAGGCAGAPDLVVWDTEGSAYKFVLIRGPGHPVRARQKMCFDLLVRGSAELEVCEVVEKGSKQRTRGRKRDASSDEDSEDELESADEDEGPGFFRRASTSKKRARSTDQEDDYQPKKKRKNG